MLFIQLFCITFLTIFNLTEAPTVFEVMGVTAVICAVLCTFFLKERNDSFGRNYVGEEEAETEKQPVAKIFYQQKKVRKPQLVYTITNECDGCDRCLFVCPTGAIKKNDTGYWIDANLCNNCYGYYSQPQCKAVCPQIYGCIQALVDSGEE